MSKITQDGFNKAKICLIENGIMPNDANDILQALCYELTGEETKQFFDKSFQTEQYVCIKNYVEDGITFFEDGVAYDGCCIDGTYYIENNYYAIGRFGPRYMSDFNDYFKKVEE